MPDISMCANRDCPSRESCYRYAAEPDHIQAFGDPVNGYFFAPPQGEDRCKFFWPMDEEAA